MIFDSLQNIAQYKGLHPHLDTAIDYLASNDVSALAPGRRELDGEAVYFNVSDTHPRAFEDTKFEAHQRYADIQIPLAAPETMEVLPFGEVDGWLEYDPERDIRFSASGAHGMPIGLSAGHFCIFFPNDAHRGGQYAPHVTQGRKLVMKVLLD